MKKNAKSIEEKIGLTCLYYWIFHLQKHTHTHPNFHYNEFALAL